MSERKKRGSIILAQEYVLEWTQGENENNKKDRKESSRSNN